MRMRALAGLALVLAGCEAVSTFCTEIGCLDGWNVELQRSAWPDGAYALDVEQDGVVDTCTFDLPWNQNAVCTNLSLSYNQSEGSLWLTRTGAGNQPSSVLLTLRVDGVDLDAADVPLTWEEVAPNGEDCDPICQTGSGSWAVAR